ncbi:hypothetical protein ILUMI_13386 [Ignelater luminosus]|uniref:Zinc carboxypeptidase A 1 n=1 Tax=Ignelater luminosus TaxID=2038154 RepID=A0A8K0CXW1_IGNLU|nr:hypothetical protein ILUMI_13386 [Ignelater luminosus]
MDFLLFLLLVATASCLQTKDLPIRFDNFQVYHVIPRTSQQLEILKRLQENPQGFNFWNEVAVTGRKVDIMVPPHLKYNFRDLVQEFDAELWIENVQQLLDNEGSQVDSKPDDFHWTDYHTLESIYAWMDSLARKYPDIVTPLVGGRSYEGREIRGVKLSFGTGKKGIFMEGGIHAREWISPATVTYMLNELLSSDNATVRAVAESRDWYFFPSVNPDGYVYTITNRMWRKTRKPYGLCVGADPNRNWNYRWMNGGASQNRCSEIFAGDAPFSEPETKSLSEFINSVSDTLDIYLAFHSYSQLLLIPFGHQGREIPKNNDELHRIGRAAADSLRVRYGTEFKVGNIPNMLPSLSSGGSIDWVLGEHRNIRIVYAYELRDTGRYGFILPPEQIIPSGEETLDSLVRLIHEVDSS